MTELNWSNKVLLFEFDHNNKTSYIGTETYNDDNYYVPLVEKASELEIGPTEGNFMSVSFGNLVFTNNPKNRVHPFNYYDGSYANIVSNSTEIIPLRIFWGRQKDPLFDGSMYLSQIVQEKYTFVITPEGRTNRLLSEVSYANEDQNAFIQPTYTSYNLTTVYYEGFGSDFTPSWSTTKDNTIIFTFLGPHGFLEGDVITINYAPTQDGSSNVDVDASPLWGELQRDFRINVIDRFTLEFTIDSSTVYATTTNILGYWYIYEYETSDLPWAFGIVDKVDGLIQHPSTTDNKWYNPSLNHLTVNRDFIEIYDDGVLVGTNDPTDIDTTISDVYGEQYWEFQLNKAQLDTRLSTKYDVTAELKGPNVGTLGSISWENLPEELTYSNTTSYRRAEITGTSWDLGRLCFPLQDNATVNGSAYSGAGYDDFATNRSNGDKVRVAIGYIGLSFDGGSYDLFQCPAGNGAVSNVFSMAPNDWLGFTFSSNWVTTPVLRPFIPFSGHERDDVWYERRGTGQYFVDNPYTENPQFTNHYASHYQNGNSVVCRFKDYWRHHYFAHRDAGNPPQNGHVEYNSTEGDYFHEIIFTDDDLLKVTNINTGNVGYYIYEINDQTQSLYTKMPYSDYHSRFLRHVGGHRHGLNEVGSSPPGMAGSFDGYDYTCPNSFDYYTNTTLGITEDPSKYGCAGYSDFSGGTSHYQGWKNAYCWPHMYGQGKTFGQFTFERAIRSGVDKINLGDSITVNSNVAPFSGTYEVVETTRDPDTKSLERFKYRIFDFPDDYVGTGVSQPKVRTQINLLHNQGSLAQLSSIDEFWYFTGGTQTWSPNNGVYDPNYDYYTTLFDAGFQGHNYGKFLSWNTQVSNNNVEWTAGQSYIDFKGDGWNLSGFSAYDPQNDYTPYESIRQISQVANQFSSIRGIILIAGKTNVNIEGVHEGHYEGTYFNNLSGTWENYRTDIPFGSSLGYEKDIQVWAYISSYGAITDELIDDTGYSNKSITRYGNYFGTRAPDQEYIFTRDSINDQITDITGTVLVSGKSVHGVTLYDFFQYCKTELEVTNLDYSKAPSIPTAIISLWERDQIKITELLGRVAETTNMLTYIHADTLHVVDRNYEDPEPIVIPGYNIISASLASEYPIKSIEMNWDYKRVNADTHPISLEDDRQFVRIENAPVGRSISIDPVSRSRSQNKFFLKQLVKYLTKPNITLTIAGVDLGITIGRTLNFVREEEQLNYTMMCESIKYDFSKFETQIQGRGTIKIIERTTIF